MIVLLLTAVLPMIAVRVVQAVSNHNLRTSIAQDMRHRLTNQAEQDMLRTVDGYAGLLDHQAQRGFLLLQNQASQVEHRLVGPVQPNPVFVPSMDAFARYLEQGDAPYTIESSDRHAVMNEAGEAVPQMISYDTQVVLVPESDGPLSRETQDDIAKLGTMTRVYREMHAQGDDTILWQYTSLTSGLHFTYPAKAGLPPGYAPQERGWYQRALLARGPVASEPYIDASTGQLVVTFSRPVMGRDRRAGGVTAIDLRVSDLLDPMDLNTAWAEQARVIVVAAYPALDEVSDQPDALPPPNPTRAPDQPPGIGDQRNQTDRPDLYPPDRSGEIALDEHPDEDNRLVNRQAGADTSYPAGIYVVADPHELGSNTADQVRTLGFDSEEDEQGVIEDLIAGVNGVRQVSVDGEQQMIAYGRIAGNDDRPMFAMIMVPTATILQPAESAIEEVEASVRQSLINTGGILLLLLIVVGLIAFVLSFRLTRPIVEIADASRRVASGDLDTRVKLDERGDELGQLGRAFNDMVPALRDRMRIRESLAVAMQVQQSLLPSSAPKMAGLDIAGTSDYCDETGGDYYDFIELDQLGPDTIAIAVGDVTGHGIAAALLMATGRALIRSHANTTGSLGEVFTAVNKQLCNSEFTGRFMTLMYLIVQNQPDASGSVPIRYLSAGHDPVMVYRPAADSFIELAGRDIPLGIDAAWGYHEENSDALRPGDILVVGTDGIWECFNAQGEQFGKERMREVVRRSADLSSEEIARAMNRACREWRGEREQNDDITLVVVKLAGG